MRSSLQSDLFDKLKDKKRCVVGQVMIDHYRLLMRNESVPKPRPSSFYSAFL